MSYFDEEFQTRSKQIDENIAHQEGSAPIIASERRNPLADKNATLIGFTYDDGGRETAGFKGDAGDCVVRSVAIASGRSYADVYAELSAGCRNQRKTRRSNKKVSARDGVNVKRKWFTDYMVNLGFEWVPTMAIGSGCKVHLRSDELPSGHVVAQLSKHYVAVIEGTIHDAYDCSRNGTRCVYGYWQNTKNSSSGGKRE